MAETDPRPSEEHIRRSRKLAHILLPALREVARRHGYALAIHGSLERDIDLIAVPWREGAIDSSTVIRAIFDVCVAIFGHATGPCGWTETEGFDPPVGSLPNPNRLPHGRLGWSILFGTGPYLDISIMPRVVAETKKPRKARPR